MIGEGGIRSSIKKDRSEKSEKSTGEGGKEVDEIVVQPGKSSFKTCRMIAMSSLFCDLSANGTAILSLKGGS